MSNAVIIEFEGDKVVETVVRRQDVRSSSLRLLILLRFELATS